ncbi:MAG: TA system antitoxin ParD family protein [Limimaricola soesokkakensis]|uniref:TA system antitoxin ParD family protein n=1 Tax=Limimaricola soesokkakensis TaxID=1343159 RepID=UPI0040586E86
MAQSVKLADEVMALVRREAALHSRSVAGQITHWLKIGRAIEQSGTYDHTRITAALEGRLDTTQLREEEETAWLDAFTEKMGQPSEAEEAFYAGRRALGRGVGLDAGGNLTYATDDAAA